MTYVVRLKRRASVTPSSSAPETTLGETKEDGAEPNRQAAIRRVFGCHELEHTYPDYRKLAALCHRFEECHKS
jgi:hypothetical protein